MTIMRNYKMFTYRVSFTYRTPVRDALGETTGKMTEAEEELIFKLVALNHTLAEAWVQQRYNAEHQKHTNFTWSLIQEEEAPYFLVEIPF